MQELDELRTYIASGQYQAALALLAEMEEMSRDDKINRISIFMEVLLVHRIKQAAEKKTTRVWDVAIGNALRQIININKRRKLHGWYLTPEELLEALEDAYASALDTASLDIFGGQWTAEEIGATIDRAEIIRQACETIHAVAGNPPASA